MQKRDIGLTSRWEMQVSAGLSASEDWDRPLASSLPREFSALRDDSATPKVDVAIIGLNYPKPFKSKKKSWRKRYVLQRSPIRRGPPGFPAIQIRGPRRYGARMRSAKYICCSGSGMVNQIKCRYRFFLSQTFNGWQSQCDAQPS